jgi:hypothetical protein
MEGHRFFGRAIGRVVADGVAPLADVGDGGGVGMGLNLPHGGPLRPLHIAQDLAHDPSVGPPWRQRLAHRAVERPHDVEAVRGDVDAGGGVRELRGDGKDRILRSLRSLRQRGRDCALHRPSSSILAALLHQRGRGPPQLGEEVSGTGTITVDGAKEPGADGGSVVLGRRLSRPFPEAGNGLRLTGRSGPDVAWVRKKSMHPKRVSRVAALGLLLEPSRRHGVPRSDREWVTTQPDSVPHRIAGHAAERTHIAHHIPVTSGARVGHQSSASDGAISRSVGRVELAITRQLSDDVIHGQAPTIEAGIFGSQLGANGGLHGAQHRAAQQLREQRRGRFGELDELAVDVLNGKWADHAPTQSLQRQMHRADRPSDACPGASPRLRDGPPGDGVVPKA